MIPFGRWGNHSVVELGCPLLQPPQWVPQHPPHAPVTPEEAPDPFFSFSFWVLVYLSGFLFLLSKPLNRLSLAVPRVAPRALTAHGSFGSHMGLHTHIHVTVTLTLLGSTLCLSSDYCNSRFPFHFLLHLPISCVHFGFAAAPLSLTFASRSILHTHANSPLFLALPACTGITHSCASARARAAHTVWFYINRFLHSLFCAHVARALHTRTPLTRGTFAHRTHARYTARALASSLAVMVHLHCAH